MTVSFTLFGSFHVAIGDGTILRDRDFGGRKPKQLLELLLLQEGRFLAKEQLADLLWGDAPPSNFMSTVEHYVSVVRKRLEPGGRTAGSLLVTGHGGYRIDIERANVDITGFDQIVDSGTADLAAIESGLALVTGDVLEDEPYSEWALKARAYYSQRHQRLLMIGAEAALAGHNPVRAGELAAQAVRADPLLEAGYRLMMTAQYMRGEQREAVLTFRTCQRVLAEDADLAPMAETLALHQAIVDRTPLEQLLPAAERRRGTLLKSVTAADAPARVERPPAQPAGEQAPTDAPPLIGRHSELRTLLELCAPPATGEPAPSLATAVVNGEAGVGKTRLLDEAAARLTELPVLRLRCTPLESGLRGALITDVVRGIAGVQAAHQLVDNAVDAPDWTGAGSQPSMVLAVGRLLRGCEPFVAMIDDAQWADPDSVAMLFSAARRSGPEGGGALIFAYRTEALPVDSPLIRVEPATRVDLKPLSRDELAPYGGEALFADTGGLPLYLAHRMAHGPDARLVVSTALRAAVLGQAKCYGEDMFRIATIASGLPQPYGPEEIARLLGRDTLTVADQLEQLLDMGIAKIDGCGFSFRYGVVREILWDTVSPARRRLLAGRVRAARTADDRRTPATARQPELDRRSGDPDRRGAGTPTAPAQRVTALRPATRTAESARAAESA